MLLTSSAEDVSPAQDLLAAVELETTAASRGPAAVTPSSSLCASSSAGT